MSHFPVYLFYDFEGVNCDWGIAEGIACPQPMYFANMKDFGLTFFFKKKRH
jgi:hypothetical protein